MRTIYLLRHGEPDFPKGIRRCIGTTDYPLSPLGRIQARLLELYFMSVSYSGVYCSGFTRAYETAGFIGGNVKVVPEFRELGLGEWENLTFSEIRERYPELYEQRGIDPSAHTPPGGETFAEAQERAFRAFTALIAETSGNIVLVAHAGINRLLLCGFMGMPLRGALDIPQPYGCVNTIEIDGSKCRAVSVGALPKPALDRQRCLSLLEAVGATEELINHCVAVSELGLEMSEKLNAAGYVVDKDTLMQAALLHDIARNMPKHAETGADWLRVCGYGELADIIAVHTDLPESNDNLEAETLYLADKLVSGARPVTLSRRFAASAQKCKTEESKRIHTKRYERAKRVLNRYLERTGD